MVLRLLVQLVSKGNWLFVPLHCRYYYDENILQKVKGMNGGYVFHPDVLKECKFYATVFLYSWGGGQCSTYWPFKVVFIWFHNIKELQSAVQFRNILRQIFSQKRYLLLYRTTLIYSQHRTHFFPNSLLHIARNDKTNQEFLRWEKKKILILSSIPGLKRATQNTSMGGVNLFWKMHLTGSLLI